MKKFFVEVKLTKEEKAILESLREQWKWMARDKNGILYFYDKKPTKDNTIWNFYYGCDFEYGDLSKLFKDELFSFVTWEDEEPTSIDELLENKEESKYLIALKNFENFVECHRYLNKCDDSSFFFSSPLDSGDYQSEFTEDEIKSLPSFIKGMIKTGYLQIQKVGTNECYTLKEFRE